MQRKLDSNNFTCKYCAGSIDYMTKKFVHDKRCQLATASNAGNVQAAKVSSGNNNSNNATGTQQANLTNQRKLANKAGIAGANGSSNNCNQ